LKYVRLPKAKLIEEEENEIDNEENLNNEEEDENVEEDNNKK
jgi:hypothetical protein